MAYYHTLPTQVLGDYYTDLHASINYHCAEYQHPLEATFWKVDVTPNFKDKIECTKLMCAQGSVTHIS